ncbi:MAG: DUF4268 domain-containing protein [Dehalococcoidia bacterium]|nr:DUF4268 domain-containing protein [Dehalococcoidia bacterium]
MKQCQQQPNLILGRLERVELRNAWQGEATDFTPWLAQSENISLLGDAIGVELEVESQEKSVGPFRADILCKDTVTNHYVLIENQLERTDHTHMGQLITYTAGLEAVTIIWVASRFTEEHRAALDWLNSVTRPDINFFGLEIELWRIGGSDMAPKFNIVSKPNDWSKVVRDQAATAADGGLTEFQRLHLNFWTQFRQYLEERRSPVRTNRPSKDHWSNVAVGRTGFSLVPWNGMRDNRSGVYLQFAGPDAKAHYSLVERHYKDNVEEKLSPLGTLTWRPLPNAKEKQISLIRSSTPTKPETWSELNEWMARALETMHVLFNPIVKALNASEYVESSADPAGMDAGLPDDSRGE